MDDCKEQYCTFCLNLIGDENCIVINGFTKEIVNVVMPKLDIVNYSDHLMCNICSGKLSAALIFKSTCLNTDDTLFPYTKKAVPVDLSEVYMKEREISVSDVEKVCRLCMEPTKEEFVFVKELAVDFFEKYIPEVDLNVTLDPVVCNRCVSNLIVHSSFIKRFFKVKGKIRKFYTEKVVSKETYVPLSDVCLDIDEDKYMNTDEIETKHYESNVIKQERTIKTEEIEIKYENIAESFQIMDPPKELDEFHRITQKSRKDSCELQHYKCDRCDYKTKVKGNLKKHMLTHKDSSEIRWYKCDKCDYKAKHKESFKLHMLIHKDSSEIQWYKCDKCVYISKQKRNLITHMLIHKDSSEIRWYKCDICDYKAKHKGTLITHMLIHTDSSEIHWFKCEICAYKSKLKETLKRHMLTQRFSEIQ